MKKRRKTPDTDDNKGGSESNIFNPEQLRSLSAAARDAVLKDVQDQINDPEMLAQILLKEALEKILTDRPTHKIVRELPSVQQVGFAVLNLSERRMEEAPGDKYPQHQGNLIFVIPARTLKVSVPFDTPNKFEAWSLIKEDRSGITIRDIVRKKGLIALTEPSFFIYGTEEPEDRVRLYFIVKPVSVEGAANFLRRQARFSEDIKNLSTTLIERYKAKVNHVVQNGINIAGFGAADDGEGLPCTLRIIFTDPNKDMAKVWREVFAGWVDYM